MTGRWRCWRGDDSGPADTEDEAVREFIDHWKDTHSVVAKHPLSRQNVRRVGRTFDSGDERMKSAEPGACDARPGLTDSSTSTQTKEHPANAAL